MEAMNRLARELTTPLDWSDLVLDEATRARVEEIHSWARHGDRLVNDAALGKVLAPGFRSLFHGPSGTGKTLTAALLGKGIGLPVYRIDLSRIISKYIGETEKNLAQLFDAARRQRWILFFDEADALFGKRTEVQSAHERYANQEVSYLLRRIEGYPGIVILETNRPSHLDAGLARRFQSVIHFPMPTAEQRLELWRRTFDGSSFQLADEVDLRQLARRHELSGGQIVNVARLACLAAAERQPAVVRARDLLQAINREIRKAVELEKGPTLRPSPRPEPPG